MVVQSSANRIITSSVAGNFHVPQTCTVRFSPRAVFRVIQSWQFHRSHERARHRNDAAMAIVVAEEMGTKLRWAQLEWMIHFGYIMCTLSYAVLYIYV